MAVHDTPYVSLEKDSVSPRPQAHLCVLELADGCWVPVLLGQGLRSGEAAGGRGAGQWE